MPCRTNERHGEPTADFSERNVGDSIALGDRGNGFRPDFLVKLGALIAKSDVRHALLPLGLRATRLNRSTKLSKVLMPNLLGVILLSAQFVGHLPK